MVIFRYVEDKDVFQKFYSKMLAKRLVQQNICFQWCWGQHDIKAQGQWACQLGDLYYRNVCVCSIHL